ncbi:MAG TPA: murein L,D-transpeptidase catalytic domain family protein [Dokdonella sp.]|nr:murein L,D-transpeptidase catalytic domain family protein [Dokdonella sp.]
MARPTLNPALLLALLLPCAAQASSLLDRLLEQAPDAPPQVLTLALEARDCAAELGAAAPSARLAVVDYSRPSTERRLWLFDLQTQRLLHAEYVAHGRGSGENFAHAFSNVEGSHQSSLGLFRTEGTYIGGNGYSLLLDGLEPGTNDRARERRIVMHGANYVDPLQALRQGRLGRSFGCPALRPQVARAVIDDLKDGQLLFAYYPDPAWLAHSPYLSCSRRVAQHAATQDDAARRPAGS